jgi:Domain of unknown function (DUF4386)
MSVLADKGGLLVSRRATSAQTYARFAAILILLSFVGGGFGEAYVPAKLIVPGDAAATVANLRSSEALFRWGFAAYLLEACCDITLALVFYVLLRPVHRYISLLTAFFGLLATASFAGSELFYFAPMLILKGSGYLKSFSPDQLNSLALLSLNLFGLGAVLFTVFYGVVWVLRGYLIFRSGYLPKFLGILMAIAGSTFIISNFGVVLAPGFRADWLPLPMLLGLLTLAVWLLVKGINLPRWEAKIGELPFA